MRVISRVERLQARVPGLLFDEAVILDLLERRTVRGVPGETPADEVARALPVNRISRKHTLELRIADVQPNAEPRLVFAASQVVVDVLHMSSGDLEIKHVPVRSRDRRDWLKLN